ncbi:MULTISPECIES: hypothetical protein [Vibrio]|uniref:hypothetical protein n=1 Tax=Vibrio TaxID=662 RepID=UPI00187F3A9B|nr:MULTISPECIES: hypothetical protein [Vibrio]MCF7355739.1 hypothetical protein [Vibrio sp. CK2-1]
MKLKKLGVIAIFMSFGIFSASASAQKTYTPAQLKGMVQSGSYPKQGSVSSKTLNLDYVSCISKVDSIVDSIKANYPTQTVVSTNVLRIEKVWTNDAAMTLTCSAADKNLVITTAAYL